MRRPGRNFSAGEKRGILRTTTRNLKEESIMSIVVNIYYSGENGSARKFAKEMISSGTVDAIRNEAGNIRYDYFSLWEMKKLCY